MTVRTEKDPDPPPRQEMVFNNTVDNLRSAIVRMLAERKIFPTRDEERYLRDFLPKSGLPISFMIVAKDGRFNPASLYETFAKIDHSLDQMLKA